MQRSIIFFMIVAGITACADERCDFLLAAVSSTGEDVSLLAFADWLDEHDDPSGEVVRMQVHLNRARQRLQHDPDLDEDRELIAALELRRKQLGRRLRDVAIPLPQILPFSDGQDEFVDIPILETGTETRLGSSFEESGFHHAQEPVRWVVLTQPFAMQRNPVTQLQWALVMGRNPSHFTRGGFLRAGTDLVDPHRPVENVSWEDAEAFLLRLNAFDSKYLYRLPTEAEWEYAARSEKLTSYCFGEDVNHLRDYGWYWGNSDRRTQWVRSLMPNGYGLYDMHGNVWEWTRDEYWIVPPGVTGFVLKAQVYPYPRDPVAINGVRTHYTRVVRGGSWYNTGWRLRSARREHAGMSSRDSHMGFRLVRVPK